MSYTELLTRLGLVPSEAAAEFNHWGFPQPTVAEPAREQTAEEVVASIRERAEGEEATEMRQTDLDVLKQYVATQQSGKLHLVIRDLAGEVVSTGTIKVTFGRTPTGDYIVPWNHESIEEYMVDPDTYLQDGRSRVRFTATRELWFGETKSFMVATPITPTKDSDVEEG